MPIDPTTIREVVAQVGRELDPRLQPLTAELATLLFDEIPAFRGDDSIRELMTASTAANLSTIFDILLHGLPVDKVDVPAAAAAYARRFAQRDLPVEGLLRAYRLGQQQATQWCLTSLGARDLDTDVLLGSTREIVSVLSTYIDRVSENLVEIYETERKLWTQRTDAARAVALRTVLDDDTLDSGTAEAMIGYRMHGWHVGAVAWVERAVGQAGRQLDSATRILASVHGERPLVVLDDDHTLWAWLSSPDRTDLDEVALADALGDVPQLRIALGEPMHGLTGFRASHREALQARTVAEASTDRSQITRFAQVSVIALLSENLEALRTWISRTLGDLATDDEANARLRETVRIFLETGGSFTDAASRLHLHKNTVHYRVRKAEEVRGRPFGEDRLDVEVALVACHHLGQRVLR